MAMRRMIATEVHRLPISDRNGNERAMPRTPSMLLRGAYCVSFDNAGIVRIANNLAAWADPYNEISAQICAKGEYKGEEEL